MDSLTLRSDAVSKEALALRELEALFRQEYDRLVRALHALGWDRCLAEEAVQEAFLRANRDWTRISRYQDPAGWVRRVALNRLRSQRRSPWYRLRVRLAEGDSTAEEELSTTAIRTDSLALRDALRALPFRQRTAAVLYYVGGYSVPQTAAAMGVSEGTVKQHLTRARENLRRALEE